MQKFTVRRYILFLVSLFVNAFGIAFITRALLGTSPITSVTYVLSMCTPWTMGQWTIMLNILFVVLEMPFMNKAAFRTDLRMFLLQIPISFCFGMFIDCAMGILSWLNPVTYINQIVALLVGCFILAAGIALEVKADIAMMAGEFFVRVLSKRFKVEFGYMKLGFDITLVLMACALSLVFMSGVYGVREGTVAAAVLVGPIVHFVSPWYRVFDRWIRNPEVADKAHFQGSGHVIITITREYGSGGRLLGEMLSSALGIRVYDKEFIHLAAAKSGMDEQYIIRNEQSIPSFWLKCILSRSSEQSVEHSLSSNDVLFVSESKVIQELAETSDCIIVGRCSDFVLKEHPHVIRVFCYADPDSACERAVTRYGLSPDTAGAEIRRINRSRIAHYEYYTGDKWGDPHHYNLMINTGSMSLDVACELIAGVYRHARAGIDGRKA